LLLGAHAELVPSLDEVVSVSLHLATGGRGQAGGLVIRKRRAGRKNHRGQKAKS
jgi:hypothetical protein